jgi:hypothetical protein
MRETARRQPAKPVMAAWLVLGALAVACGGARLRGPGQPSIYHRSFAVVVGINRYTDLPPLTAASPDAKSVARTLQGQGFRLVCGEGCEGPVLDGSATKEHLKTLLETTLPSMLSSGDRVVVYFAGHGQSLRRGSGLDGYLLPVNASKDKIADTGLAMTDIQGWLEGYAAKHVMLVADACYSGLALSTRSVALSSTTVDYARLISERKVRFTLVAGRDDQEASEHDGHGVFTKFWLEGIAGHADSNGDDLVTSDELYAFVGPRVFEFVAKNMNREQTPQYARSGQGELVFAVGGSDLGGAEADSRSTAQDPPRPPPYPPRLSGTERRYAWLRADQLLSSSQRDSDRLALGRVLYDLGYPFSAELRALRDPFTDEAAKPEALRLRADVSRQLPEGLIDFTVYTDDELSKLREDLRAPAIFQKLLTKFVQKDYAWVTANVGRVGRHPYYAGRAAYVEGLAWVARRRSIPAIRAFRRSRDLMAKWRTPADVSERAALSYAQVLYTSAISVNDETNSPDVNKRRALTALTLFQAIPTESIWYPKAREGLLWSQYMLNQDQAALQTASWLWSRFPSLPSTRAKVIEAMIRFQQQDYDRSIRTLDALRRRLPKYPLSGICRIDPVACPQTTGWNSLSALSGRLQTDEAAFTFADRLLSGAEQSPPLDSFAAGALSDVRFNQDLSRQVDAVRALRRELAQLPSEQDVGDIRALEELRSTIAAEEQRRVAVAAKTTRELVETVTNEADEIILDSEKLLIDITAAKRNILE